MTKYESIASDLRGKIKSGELEKNSALPFEYELCEIYKCSKQTIKKALEILVFEGLIYRQRGKGTFVKSTFNLNSYEISNSYVSGQTQSDKGAHVITNKLLLFEVVNPDSEVANILNITTENFVFHFKKYREIDGRKPVVIESFVPIDVIPGLTKKVVSGSFFSYVENDLNLKIKSVHKKLTVDIANEECMKLFNFEKELPVAIVEGIHFLSTGEIFEYSISIHSYEEFVFNSIHSK
ncbi:GntR family transcriptional regulator [Mollicutes bacterium LVI A0039]|nr:GntR family transcriptional regulator [Mollicutes bacterium LVI A0039]